MLKLFTQYRYLVFCSLSGIILTKLKRLSLFLPTHMLWTHQRRIMAKT